MERIERRKYPVELVTRMSLVEHWQEKHEAWSEHQVLRLDTLWDWRSEVKATLRTTNRLLWTVLTALCADIGVSLYLVVSRH